MHYAFGMIKYDSMVLVFLLITVLIPQRYFQGSECNSGYGMRFGNIHTCVYLSSCCVAGSHSIMRLPFELDLERKLLLGD